MSLFSDLITPATLSGVRSTITAYASAGALRVSDWIGGGLGEQILEAVSQTVQYYSATQAKLVRGYADLDTSTDPGDEDPYDAANAGLTPAAGMLSNLGENVYSTARRGETFGTCTVTFDNSAGTTPRTFGPGDLVFTWTGGTPPSPAPTYTNATDAAVYTDPDGTVTVAAGATLDITVQADESGTRSNAPSSTLSLTTALVGATATNTTPVVGSPREGLMAYRARCRKAMSRLSLGGVPSAYEYLATTTIDGDPLLNASETQVAISRVQVIQDSTDATVDVYFATDSGAPSAEDVTAANANIQTEAIAVPGCITYTGTAASEVTVSVAGSVKIKATAGVTSAVVKAAIVAALGESFPGIPIGGMDQDAGGNGKLYTSDLLAIVGSAYPGIYSPAVTTPGASYTAISVGEVAVLDSDAADWTVTIV